MSNLTVGDCPECNGGGQLLDPNEPPSVFPRSSPAFGLPVTQECEACEGTGRVAMNDSGEIEVIVRGSYEL